MGLSAYEFPCPVHSTDLVRVVHPPAHCRTEHVLHPVVCKPRPKAKEEVSPGTHRHHLDKDPRDRRAAKNARNRKRKNAGTDTRAPDPGRIARSRLWSWGNRAKRGVN